jgi:hypothetical protein
MRAFFASVARRGGVRSQCVRWLSVVCLACLGLTAPCAAQQLSLTEPCGVSDTVLRDRQHELAGSIASLRGERDEIMLRAPLWVMGGALATTTASLYGATRVDSRDAVAGLTAVAALGSVVLVSSVLTLGVRRYQRGRLIRELGPLRVRANELEAIGLLRELGACNGTLERRSAQGLLVQRERAARAQLRGQLRPARALFFTGAALVAVGAVTFLSLMVNGLYRLKTNQPGSANVRGFLLLTTISVPSGLVTMLASSGRLQRLRRRTEPDLDHVRALHMARRRLGQWDDTVVVRDEPPAPELLTR